METSHPDTPKPALKGQAEVTASPPEHLAWRLEAACQDADTDLFMIMDAEELGCPPHQVASLNKMRLAYAREEFCDHCPVTAECNDSAVFEGSHAWSLRGGITPYEREGVKAGRPKPDGLFKANSEADDAAEVRAWLRGEPIGDRQAGKDARRRYLKGITEGPQTAFWEAHEVRGSRNPSPVSAGAGWALSQDLTGTVLMVAHRTGVGMRTRYVMTAHTEFDQDSVPRVLVEGYPDGVTLPKEEAGFWKNHKSKRGFATFDNGEPWWKENGMYTAVWS